MNPLLELLRALGLTDWADRLETAPDSLDVFSDEDLAALDADLIAQFETISATATAETLQTLQAIAEQTDAIRTEAGARATARETLANEVIALRERVAPPVASDTGPEGGDEGEGGEGDGGEGDAGEGEAQATAAEIVAEAEQILETAPEVVTAATTTTPAPQRGGAVTRQRANLAPLGRLAGDTGRVATIERPRAQVSLAFADPSTEVNRRSLADAMIRADKGIGAAAVGVEVRIPVASVTAAWDEERRIPEGATTLQATSVVQRVVGTEIPNGPIEVLTAAGGICAPVTPYYGSEVIASRARPVRDFLTGFNAARGGIAFTRPYTLAQFSAALTNHTMAADEAGAGKNCYHVPCPTPNEEVVGAVVACLEFGNFQGRFNPEQVAAASDLTAAAHARLGETLLLDALRASQNFEVVTIAGGAIADILYSIGAAAAGYRSRNRMDPGATLDVLLPAWIVNLLQGDLARQPMGEPGQFGIAEAAIRSWLAARGVRVGFYLDSPSTGTSQIFGAQPGGGLLDFPDKVQWGMWHPGAHLFLDAGTLDLGIVRDSTLNNVNDYQQFMETFEGHAFTGVESLWVEQDICASGTQALPKDLSGICGGPFDPGS